MAHFKRARRGLALVVTLAIASVGLTGPAYALDGPQARDDVFTSTRTAASDMFGNPLPGPAANGNVLANDTWDAGQTAILDTNSVTVLSAWIEQYDSNRLGARTPNPLVKSSEDGLIKVEFGAYPYADSPSGVRYVRLAYTLRDSAGQESSATAVFREANPVDSMAPSDDDNDSLGWPGFDFGGTSAVGLQPYFNDTAGLWGNYVVDVVEPPTYGTVSTDLWDGGGMMTYTVGDEAFSERTDQFSYRYCLVADPSACSAAATVRFTASKSDGAPAPLIEAQTTESFWEGGAKFEILDPLQIVLAQHPDLPAGDTIGAPEHQPLKYGSLTDYGDGTYTYAYDGNLPDPVNGAVAVEQTINFPILDGDGHRVGLYRAYFNFVPPLYEDTTLPQVRADEVWVKVGDEVSFEPLINDTVDTTPSYLWEPVGATRGEFYLPRWTGAQAALGNVRAPQGDETRLLTDFYPHRGWVSTRVIYTAGDTAGTDVLTYEMCAQYPVKIACSENTVTVHVSPLAVATDDEAEAKPGGTVDVPVLGNDVYTDTPAKGAEVIVLTDVPAGVDAVVTPDRTVAVSVPADFVGDQVDLGYQLTDFTGSSRARVRVAVSRGDVVPPTDPVTPDPFTPVDPTDPVTPVDPTDPVVPPLPLPPVTPTPTDPVTPVRPKDPAPRTVPKVDPAPPVTPDLIDAGAALAASETPGDPGEPAGLLIAAGALLAGLVVARKRVTG